MSLTARSLAVLFAVAAPGAALAAEAALPPAKLVYGLSIAGVPVADADMSLDDRAGRYSLDIDWRTVGLAGVFASAKGRLGASGRLVGGRPHPQSYHLSEKKGDQPFEVAMKLSGGSVSGLTVDPPAKTGDDIVPVLPEHRRGITDPLSAALVAGSVEPGKLCDRTLPIFDGWSRWNIRLSPKSVSDEAAPGLRGPTVTCAARWEPVAGHRTGHKGVKYMAENRAMELRYARLPDRDLWLPVEASVGTMIGTARTRLESVGVAP